MTRFARIVSIACISFLSTPTVFAQSSAAPSATPTELPRGVRPTHYEIALEPNAEALTFAGKTTIALEVLQPTKTLTLHALDLEFASARLTRADANRPGAAPQIQVDPERQTATFTFDAPLAAGAYRLALDYTGKIGTNPAGLFAVDYDTPAGKRRALYTQLAIADARRMIPSWDEPAFKATFSLQATVPSDSMAVSNMPIATRAEVDDGRTRVTFERTPRMSTYLLFFALGEFDRITTKVGPTELGIITRKGASDQGKFALDSSARVLREFNDYFATPYPLPKLDNIAVPASSQAWAAMENWGAIFSFEYVLLLDPSISTQADRHNVFEIAAHEIAHQWFGNLVTMRWWDDVWLNEGFASWLASRTTARLHPEWDAALAAVNSRDYAMERDALASTHPIVQPIETVNEANEAFDVITYRKGDAVLRMLEAYLGETAWREGVRRYIDKHAYGSTTSEDLWREIEATSREPVAAIAHDFTLQQGVPLIRVEAADCRNERAVLRLAQGEYSRDQPNKKSLAWRVPVIVKALGSDSAIRKLVTDGSADIQMPSCAPAIVNAGQTGYFRTLYAPPQFAAIAERFGTIAAVDQLGILADSWALGLTGHQPVTDFFALAKATPLDADPQVWGKIARTFSLVSDYYSAASPQRARLREFAVGRLAPKFEQVGWTPRRDEPDPVSILRTDLIDALSALGDAALIEEARRRFAAQATDPTAIPGPMRKAILGVVARHADGKTWNALHAAARAEKTPLVKSQLYALLGAAEDPALVRRAFDLALTAEPGAANSLAMIASTARLHPDVAFDFALAHPAEVHGMLDPLGRLTFVPALARASSNQAILPKLNEYAAAHLPVEARRSVDAARGSIADRIRVVRERLPALDAWLQQNVR